MGMPGGPYTPIVFVSWPFDSRQEAAQQSKSSENIKEVCAQLLTWYSPHG